MQNGRKPHRADEADVGNGSRLQGLHLRPPRGHTCLNSSMQSGCRRRFSRSAITSSSSGRDAQRRGPRRSVASHDDPLPPGPTGNNTIVKRDASHVHHHEHALERPGGTTRCSTWSGFGVRPRLARLRVKAAAPSSAGSRSGVLRSGQSRLFVASSRSGTSRSLSR
jgi:hypothetical protein